MKDKVKEMQDYVANSPTVRLAITEAVHRFFYDECFNPYSGKLMEGEDVKAVNDLHHTLHCQIPDWRFRLKKKQFERYHGWEPTVAIDVNGKPHSLKEMFVIPITYNPLTQSP